MAQPIVKIRGVSKSFGKKEVLIDINLDINEGEIFGIIGTSGAGKTTLLESMVGFFTINKGEVAYRRDGHGLYNFLTLQKDPSLKQMIGFSTQDPSFYDRLTVKENLEYFAKMYNIPDKFIAGRIKKIVEFVELTGDENTLGGELSGGMQKRLDIACSLVNDPKILILDEPTAAVDAKAEYDLFRKFRQFTKNKMTFLISHRFSTVRMASKIVVMDRGKIIEEGSHITLMKKEGKYAKLFSMQAKGYQ